MLRLSFNRYWTLILALCLACSSLFSAKLVRAESLDPGPTETIDPGDPMASGDPDTPDGPGKTARSRRGALRSPDIRNTGGHSVGDGLTSGSTMMRRIHVAMLGLRKFYLRF